MLTAATAAPAPVHARETINTTGLHLKSLWAIQPRSLRNMRTPDLVRTADLLLRDWSVPRETRPAAVDVKLLVGSGVCLDDLAAWSRVRRRTENPSFVCGLMALQVNKMRVLAPEMTLRDAVGWMLLIDFTGQTPACRDLVQAWGSPPLPRGWLYASAGMTLDEVKRRRADGTLDKDGVRTLAALRGAVLPAGSEQ